VAVIVEHLGLRPRVHASAYVAPTAVLCGDVVVGPEARVLFGAVLIAEGGAVTLGARCIVMEHAVVRGTTRHPMRLGDRVLVGPHAHLTGCDVGDDVFLATGVAVFNGAHIGSRAEVRINGVVHVNTFLPADAVVPIGWVAVGNPAEVLPPGAHDRIWAIQEPLQFPRTVFGLERVPAGPAGQAEPDGPAGQSLMPELTSRYVRALGRHRDDRLVEAPGVSGADASAEATGGAEGAGTVGD
jgi:carbonic anhydrase/acetyltransferase-like protein (isoleucine patch superfamily)